MCQDDKIDAIVAVVALLLMLLLGSFVWWQTHSIVKSVGLPGIFFALFVAGGRETIYDLFLYGLYRVSGQRKFWEMYARRKQEELRRLDEAIMRSFTELIDGLARDMIGASQRLKSRGPVVSSPRMLP